MIRTLMGNQTNTDDQKTDDQKSGLVIFQTWHTIIIIVGIFIVIGISYATARIDIDSLKDRVTKLEQTQDQVSRIEHNLRRLLEKQGLEYEEFGSNN